MWRLGEDMRAARARAGSWTIVSDVRCCLTYEIDNWPGSLSVNSSTVEPLTHLWSSYDAAKLLWWLWVVDQRREDEV